MLTWQICEAEVNVLLLNPGEKAFSHATVSTSILKPFLQQQKHQNNQEVISREDKTSYSEKKIMIFSQMLNLTKIEAQQCQRIQLKTEMFNCLIIL